jgi:valyl-tRNA synthetase
VAQAGPEAERPLTGSAVRAGGNMAPAYDASGEAAVYAAWEAKDAFAPRPPRRRGTADDPEHFSLVMPPPNVTGVLHSGHAMDNQIPDVLVRFHRMRGDSVEWVPGMDHAGIATHARVEAKLREEGTSRHAIGRERFLERAWAFAREHRDVIRAQLKLLGVSADWAREAFTLDEVRARAVREAFVRLYEQGLMYRARAIIQWCPSCGTALSDIEVEHEERPGHLWYFAYPLAEGEAEAGGPAEVVVATTRPETVFGDVAVAVHPEDERYRALVGRHLVHPLTGRRMPVVADAAVVADFGTGAVKVTPDHDPVDFEIAARHGLSGVRVLGDDATVLPVAGPPFAGLDRYAARERVVEAMRAMGRLVRVEEHTSSVGHCTRCGTVVEPVASPQWFVRMRPLAEPVAQAVRDGRLRLHPAHFEKVLLEWIDNLRDWCVSRQLWWGHPVPAWYGACGSVIVAREQPRRCPTCGEEGLQPDPDVLDTWFSSGLWPLSVFGWPDRGEAFARWYPTSILSTGYDILFFWVFRMAVLGYHFTGRMPFGDVLLHGLMRDELNRKVSKSLGNGVDVAEVIRTHGSDALRYAVTFGVTPGNDIRYREERTLAGRNLANKIWNATRFARPYLEQAERLGLGQRDGVPARASADPRDRWILSRLEEARAAVEGELLAFEVGEGLRRAQDVFWDTLCDWYLEMAKPRLRGDEGEASRLDCLATLDAAVERVLRLLHPFAPFVTEAAWQALPGREGLLMTQSWPAFPADRSPAAEAAVEPVLEAVRRVRNLRRAFRLPPGRRLGVEVAVPDEGARASWDALSGVLVHLAGADPLSVREAATGGAGWVTEVVPGATVLVALGQAVDLAAEVGRLEAEAAQLEKERERIAARLTNPGYLAKAPADVVEGDRVRVADLEEQAARARRRRDELAAALAGTEGRGAAS